jgi:cytochrome c553
MNELSEKDAKREDRRMQQAVERLSDEQLAALAAWYARQPLPAVETDPEDQVSEATLRLVFVGDKTRLIQPRASCHGSHGQGAVIDVPAIARQNVKYFVDTMRDYARDKRTNDVYSRMRITAKALTRDEIDELAVYYARLGGQKKRKSASSRHCSTDRCSSTKRSLAGKPGDNGAPRARNDIPSVRNSRRNYGL